MSSLFQEGQERIFWHINKVLVWEKFKNKYNSLRYKSRDPKWDEEDEPVRTLNI